MTPMIPLLEAVQRLTDIGRDCDPASVLGTVHEHRRDVLAIRTFVYALLDQPGPGQVVEMLRAEMRGGADAPDRVPLTERGVPVNANDWTPEDWRDLHNGMEEVIRHIAKRHAPPAVEMPVPLFAQRSPSPVYTLEELTQLIRSQFGEDGFIVTQRSRADGSSENILTVDGKTMATWKSRLVKFPPRDGKTPRGPSEYYDFTLVPATPGPQT